MKSTEFPVKTKLERKRTTAVLKVMKLAAEELFFALFRQNR